MRKYIMTVAFKDEEQSIELPINANSKRDAVIEGIEWLRGLEGRSRVSIIIDEAGEDGKNILDENDVIVGDNRPLHKLTRLELRDWIKEY